MEARIMCVLFTSSMQVQPGYNQGTTQQLTYKGRATPDIAMEVKGFLIRKRMKPLFHTYEESKNGFILVKAGTFDMGRRHRHRQNEES